MECLTVQQMSPPTGWIVESQQRYVTRTNIRENIYVSFNLKIDGVIVRYQMLVLTSELTCRLRCFIFNR